MNQHAIATKTAVVLEPQILAVAYVLNVGMGFQLTPEIAPAWSLILGGYDADVLKFAALEYTRQRRPDPNKPLMPSDVGQLAGWLMRAIAEKRPHYTFRKAGESDAFALQFLSACGADTQAFIAARAAGPRSVAPDYIPGLDPEPVAGAVVDDEAAELAHLVARTRHRLANDGFEDRKYGEEYLAFVEARLARCKTKAVPMPP